MDSIAYLHPFKSSAHHHDSEVRTCCESEQRARPGLAQSFVFHLLCRLAVLSMTSAKRNKPEDARSPGTREVENAKHAENQHDPTLAKLSLCEASGGRASSCHTKKPRNLQLAGMSLRGEHSEFRRKTSTKRQLSTSSAAIDTRSESGLELPARQDCRSSVAHFKRGSWEVRVPSSFCPTD